MRIAFRVEGGLAYFPGLSRPITIDSDQLPENEADVMRRLVEAARFFDLPPSVGTPKRGAADYRQYTITIEDDGQSHTVRVVEPVEHPELQALLNFLWARLRALRISARERGRDPGQGPAPGTPG